MNHGPHPHIESHYHIQDLIRSQERRSNDRTYHRDREKDREARQKDIQDAKGQELKAFWCKTCKLDFLAQAVKEVEQDWSCNGQYIAFYRTKCFNGHWCQRLITDIHKDSYWTKSRKVAIDTGSHYADTLQPHDTGFNMLYKKI